MLLSASKCFCVRQNGSKCAFGAPLSVAAGRRGQPPPEQMAIGPPRRRRLPVRPPRRFTLARQSLKNSEARALSRLSLGTEVVRGELPVAPHGDPPPFVHPPPFVRHRQAKAGPHVPTTAHACLCPRRRAAALAARSRSLALLWRRACAPGLTEEGNDLVLATPPCDVEGRIAGLIEEGDDLVLASLPRAGEGRLAPLVSERRVGALLEKALDDREVAPGCTVMERCPSVISLRHTGHVREEPRGHPRGKGFGGEGSRLTFVSLTFAWASRRISTQPSYPNIEDTMSAVDPYDPYDP